MFPIIFKARVEYERCAEQFSSAKAKLEEQKARGSKRTDEYKDRLTKVCMYVFFFNFHHHFVMLLFQPAYVQLLNLKRVKFKNLVLAELKVANCELKGCVMLPIRIEETTTINNPPSPSPLGNKKWAAAEASLNTPLCLANLIF